MARTILVTGGRNYNDRARVWETLDLLHALDPIGRVIEGGARGNRGKKSADRLAYEWRVQKLIPGQTYEADWDNIHHPRAVTRTRLDGTMYDITAGLRRNKYMFDAEKVDLVVAFPTPGESNRGTQHTINLARERGIDVFVVSH